MLGGVSVVSWRVRVLPGCMDVRTLSTALHAWHCERLVPCASQRDARVVLGLHVRAPLSSGGANVHHTA